MKALTSIIWFLSVTATLVTAVDRVTVSPNPGSIHPDDKVSFDLALAAARRLTVFGTKLESDETFLPEHIYAFTVGPATGHQSLVLVQRPDVDEEKIYATKYEMRKDFQHNAKPKWLRRDF